MGSASIVGCASIADQRSFRHLEVCDLSKASEDRCQPYCSSASRVNCEPLQICNQRRTPARESLLVPDFVIESTVLPAAKHDANRLKGLGSDRGVMVDSLVPHLFVVGHGPG